MKRIHHSVMLFGLFLTGMSLVNASGCLSLGTTTPDGGGGSGGSSGNGETSSSSVSSSSGGNNACMTNNDCSGSGSECKMATCMSGICVAGNRPAGYACNDGKKVCDGTGSCVDCINDGDCDGSYAYCNDNDCISCSDGEQNGDEAGIDCGGSKCAPCAGGLCASQADCMTGTCVDGYCCDSVCDQPCKACNLNGKVGKCSSLPFGAEDTGVCEGTKACNGASALCLLKDGQPCMNDSQCLNNACVSGMCIP